MNPIHQNRKALSATQIVTQLSQLNGEQAQGWKLIDGEWWMYKSGNKEEYFSELFICKLCEMARNQKRVSATEKQVDNEKYAFRCFLLRLGFIGNEYKSERKILLKNLTGSSAFKSGAKKEVSSDEISE